jgi:hypothetical protein
LAKEGIAFDRRHVRNHVGYDVAAYVYFMKDESLARNCRTIGQDIPPGSDEVVKAHGSSSAKCLEDTQGNR